MRRTAGMFALGAASVATVLVLGTGAAAASPPSHGSASETIDRLQSEGNRVIVSKVGDGPMEHCAVTSVSRVKATPNLRPTRGAYPPRAPVYVRLDCGPAAA